MGCPPWAIGGASGALCGKLESAEKALWGNLSFGGQWVASDGVRLRPSNDLGMSRPP
jgi:hypothetical protein